LQISLIQLQISVKERTLLFIADICITTVDICKRIVDICNSAVLI